MTGSEIDIISLLPLGLAMICTGIVAGILAGLLGVGGGIVIVPVLFHIFTYLGIDESVRMHVAVGTSLATIIPTSISSARAHFKRGSVDTDLLKSWSIPILIGVVIGTALAGYVKGAVLTGIFASVALIVSANMAFRPDGWTVTDHLPKGIFKHLIATIIGCFSAMMGIGGGTLSVPILSACAYPIKRAVGTASAIGLIIAIPGTIGFVVSGIGIPDRPLASIVYANMIGFTLIVPMTIISAPYGAKLAHSMSTGWLRKAFALFLFLTALRMIHSLVF